GFVMNTESDIDIPAIVLAGGTTRPDMWGGATNRATIPIDGIPMFQRVVQALQGASAIGEIVVVGNVPPGDNYRVVADHGTFEDNVFAGLAAIGTDSKHVLYVTCDVPFLTWHSVKYVVSNGIRLNADIVYPVVPVSECY